MATLTAPLFSLKASGKIAKTLVFLPWKGLNNVRQYVIPTNPKTAAQTTQRITNFKAAVTEWHTFTLTTADNSAWTLFASTLISKIHKSYKGVMSGFNAFMRAYVDAKVANAAMTWDELSHVTSVPGAGPNLVVTCNKGKIANIPYIYYGTSKEYMPTSKAPDGGSADDNIIWTVEGLLPSTKYYFFLVASAANKAARTGIYYDTTLAA